MQKHSTEFIRAIVERTVPETIECKPFRTEMSFDGKLVIEVPVPASEVRTEKGGVIVITLDGWKSFLKT